ncbi:unnamed protein product [Bursaphelenchus okinawaensis]|uniref:Hydroxysteroid dehydrogenase-like protein 2 n=1 Tax=Bursaphelenchus okinawaensis TaxID=465554 RepID=A0A811L843_9BILA|nr:unnamed protein product [Bursaphelenchus okinawaensis]CAG9120880.1 unnamed protein product [Bursaphelenchus okinawaensis]
MSSQVRNTGYFKNKTIFISGGSRGIGLSIAKKLAADGANIVLAAKTATPHPKLPGTIYTAAKEVEEAGGKCLPCVVDIRFEDQVKKAIDLAVKTFGGIDILINNASAIHIADTESCTMKWFDLMQNINTRGTFMLSKYCLPHLKKSSNAHILNLSPPLTMDPVWFARNAAYTIAKYGMSMCVLGMSSEFKDDGIAVNALWPRTWIWTAAVGNILASDSNDVSYSRKPEICSDAAYVMLSRDAKSYTGNFAIDDDVLREYGVSDFGGYAFDPNHELKLDGFLPGTRPGTRARL